MRRALTAVVLATTVAVTGATLTAPAMADSSGGPYTDLNFGMHIPQISQGEQTSVNEGTVRLWDSGVTWGQVEQKKGKYWWNGLDAAIANANAQNLSILYVLGSTPKWAAKNPKQGKYPNKGAASMPKNIKDWKNWVKTVVLRYRDSIDAYQIWNEANLKTFWEGTPEQMAQLTKEAYKIIRKYDPTAKVVAASTTVRLKKSYNKFFPKYLKALKKQKWPVDVISFHGYPSGTGTPADRVNYIKMVQNDMKKGKVPASKALWDTEINYGIAGPGSVPPRRHRRRHRRGLDGRHVPRRHALRRRPRVLVLLVQQLEPRRHPDVQRHVRRPRLPDGPQLAQRQFLLLPGGSGRPAERLPAGGQPEPRGHRLDQRAGDYVHGARKRVPAVQRPQ